MENFVVVRDGQKDLFFYGRTVSKRSSQNPTTGEETIFELFETRAGKWVGSKTVGTDEDGTVLKNAEEIFEYFGSSKLAKQLYAESGFDYTEEID